MRRARYGSISTELRWPWFMHRISFSRPSLVLNETKSLANLSIRSRLTHFGSVSKSASNW